MVMQIAKGKRAAALFVVVASVVYAQSLRGDAYAPDRFKGGTADGYASRSLGEEASDASAMRFQGGSGDGYDSFVEIGLKVPSWGTVILVR